MTLTTFSVTGIFHSIVFFFRLNTVYYFYTVSITLK